MKRRIRTFAGLLALVALVASSTEAVVASLCAAPAGMEAVPSVAMSVDDDRSGESEDDGMPCAGMGHSDHRQGGEHCPLTPTAVQGCSAPASAPSPTLSVSLVTPVHLHHVRFDEVAREQLFAPHLYRPPRA